MTYIDALTPQNEPNLPAWAVCCSPGMVLSASDETTFVGSYLASALARAGLSSRILVFDGIINTLSGLVDAWMLLSNPIVRLASAGIAVHCYFMPPTTLSTVHAIAPLTGIYVTECSRGWVSTAGSFGATLRYDMDNLIIGATRNWVRAVLKWNLALNQYDGPQYTNPQPCTTCELYGMLTINPDTGAVSYNEDYYALGHASKFVTPGAYRIGSDTFGRGSIQDVAFRNPDGSKVLIAFNDGPASALFKVRWSGEAFTTTLPAGAAATYTWL